MFHFPRPDWCNASSSMLPMIGSPTYFLSSETTLPASWVAFLQVNCPFRHSKVPMMITDPKIKLERSLCYYANACLGRCLWSKIDCASSMLVEYNQWTVTKLMMIIDDLIHYSRDCFACRFVSVLLVLRVQRYQWMIYYAFWWSGLIILIIVG